MNKVYIVNRVAYDRDYDETYVEMKVFATKEAAEAYRETRKTADGEYWDSLTEKEVE